MNVLLGLSRSIDRMTTFVGKAVSWLILASVLISAGNAVIRKLFDMSSNAWLELQWYLFGAVFMLAAAWTLQKNEHVRIDIISNMLSRRTRNWIDFLGHLLILVPFSGLMVWLLVPYVLRSFENQEYSPNAGGLIVWPAKAILLAGFALLLLQAISELIKRGGVLFYGMEDTTPLHRAHPAAEEMEGTALIPDQDAGSPEGAPRHRDGGATR